METFLKKEKRKKKAVETYPRSRKRTLATQLVRPLLLSKKKNSIPTKLKKSNLFMVCSAAGCWGWFTPHLRVQFSLMFDHTWTGKG